MEGNRDMRGLCDPVATAEATSILLTATISSGLVAIAASLLSYLIPMAMVPSMLAFCFAHATGGLALLGWARTRHLASRSPRDPAGTMILATCHFAGATIAVFGTVVTVMVSAAVAAA